MAKTGQDIAKARKILENGGLVAIPTETVYGLAGNAFSEKAVSHIFSVKNRPSFDPLIVHCSSIEDVQRIAKLDHEKAIQLGKRFWPGPLTIVIPRGKNVSDLVTAGLDSVAVRVPSHPLTLELLQSLNFPLVAPSANPFGYVSPTTAEHVNENLGDQIDYILDGGPCELGVESTIISFIEKDPVILRLGCLTMEKIESVIGKVHLQLHSSSNPLAPGMLKSHYSPSKQIVLGVIEELFPKYKDKKVGILSFRNKKGLVEADNEFILSGKGDLEEAARNIFSTLREMDKLDINYIIAEKVPDVGIGRAINDRLQRASAEK